MPVSRSAHLLLQTELDSQIQHTVLVALGGNRNTGETPMIPGLGDVRDAEAERKVS
jgi:hypothetical protein